MEEKTISIDILLQDKNLAPVAYEGIKRPFTAIVSDFEQWKEKALSITVAGVDDEDGMNEARLARLAMKSLRVQVGKTKDELKKDAIAYGNAVQSVHNTLIAQIEPIEAHLQKLEDTRKTAIKEVQDAIRAYRENEIAPYAEFAPRTIDWGTAESDDFDRALFAAKSATEAKAKRDAEDAAAFEAQQKAAAEQADANRLAVLEQIKAEAAEAESKERTEAAAIDFRNSVSVHAGHQSVFSVQTNPTQIPEIVSEQWPVDQTAADASLRDAQAIQEWIASMLSVKVPECETHLGRDMVQYILNSLKACQDGKL